MDVDNENAIAFKVSDHGRKELEDFWRNGR